MKKRIFYSSEVASYIICPKSWRLLHDQKVVSRDVSTSDKALDERKKWQADFSAAQQFTWASRIVMFMIVFLVIFYLFTNF